MLFLRQLMALAVALSLPFQDAGARALSQALPVVSIPSNRQALSERHLFHPLLARRLASSPKIPSAGVIISRLDAQDSHFRPASQQVRRVAFIAPETAGTGPASPGRIDWARAIERHMGTFALPHWHEFKSLSRSGARGTWQLTDKDVTPSDLAHVRVSHSIRSAMWLAQRLRWAPIEADLSEQQTFLYLRDHPLATYADLMRVTGLGERTVRERLSRWLTHWADIASVLTSTDATRPLFEGMEAEALSVLRSRPNHEWAFKSVRQHVARRWSGHDPAEVGMMHIYLRAVLSVAAQPGRYPSLRVVHEGGAVHYVWLEVPDVPPAPNRSEGLRIGDGGGEPRDQQRVGPAAGVLLSAMLALLSVTAPGRPHSLHTLRAA